MTWTKLSDDFPGDLYRDGLSDAAFRTHIEAHCWSNRHLLDGRIPKRDLARFAFSPAATAAVFELVERGYWRDEGDAWLVDHHTEHQEERDTVMRRRKVDAERQRRKRGRVLDDAEARMSRRDTPRDVHRDDPRDPGRVGPGRDGKDKSAPRDEEHAHDRAHGEPWSAA
jgi:hypothetical protein